MEQETDPSIVSDLMPFTVKSAQRMLIVICITVHASAMTSGQEIYACSGAEYVTQLAQVAVLDHSLATVMHVLPMQQESMDLAYVMMAGITLRTAQNGTKNVLMPVIYAMAQSQLNATSVKNMHSATTLDCVNVKLAGVPSLTVPHSAKTSVT